MTSSKKSGIRRSDKAQAILREAGYIVTDEGVERMRQRLLALDRLQAQDIESGVPEGRDLNLK